MAAAVVGAIDQHAAHAGIAHVAEGDLLGRCMPHQSGAGASSQIIDSE
jgi:hypothetical protein